MQSDCINNKYYLGYVTFKIGHVDVLAYCNKNARLKKKVELVFSDNNDQKLKLDYKDVAKAEI